MAVKIDPTSQKKGLTLRQDIIGGDYYTAAVVGTTFSKLFLKLSQFHEVPQVEKNQTQAQILLYLTSFLQLFREQSIGTTKKDFDKYEFIHILFFLSIFSLIFDINFF